MPVNSDGRRPGGRHPSLSERVRPLHNPSSFPGSGCGTGTRRVDGSGSGTSPLRMVRFRYHFRGRHGDGGKERPGIGMQGRAVKASGIGLFHDFPQVHHLHAIADVFYQA